MALCSSNVTSGFVDLATYDELEKYMYGGADATAYFVRETRKATWFTQVPVCLSKSGGDAKFGQEWSAQISRSGDYLLNLWLEVEFPFLQAQGSGTSNDSLRWVQNLMHNLVEECSITFNDLVAARFDSTHLDFWSQFSNSGCKSSGYNAMIGNASYQGGMLSNGTDEAIPAAQSYGMNVGVRADSGQQVLPGGGSVADALYLHNPRLHLPLPFFFTRDSGVALPTAALPYNDMRVNFKFRDWKQLLVKDLANGTSRSATTEDFRVVNQVSGTTLYEEPELKNVHVWANYAIVSNDERKRMACAPRDILIEQVQSATPIQLNTDAINPNFNLRFSHAVKVLYYGLRNLANDGVDLSYYSTVSPNALDGATATGATRLSMPRYVAGSSRTCQSGQVDPIQKSSLVYENTNRLEEVSSVLTSKIQPFYHGSSCSTNDPGMHMYSYSLDCCSLDPLGSTNYGKLTNVNLVTWLSNAAKSVNGSTTHVGGTAVATAIAVEQRYQFVCSAVNNNIVRISGGALGFPVL